MMRMIYVNGAFLGGKATEGEVAGSDAENSFSRTSLSYVSPTDGKVWARCPLLDGQRVMPFFVMTVPAIGEGHRSSYGPSGSLLSSGRWMLNQMSREALRYELLIHCDWAMSRPTNLQEFLPCLNSTPSSPTVTDQVASS
jgi:hypothetical protein